MNSDLVTVHNQEENVFIQHRHAGDRSWIGLNDRSVEGSFVWTNKEISSFRFWAPKQPNDWNNEDCVHTLGVRHGYTWNDVPCDNCFNFTCFAGNKIAINYLIKTEKRRTHLWHQWCLSPYLKISLRQNIYLLYFTTTVEALVSGHPPDAIKMSVTGAGRLREWFS